MLFLVSIILLFVERMGTLIHGKRSACSAPTAFNCTLDLFCERRCFVCRSISLQRLFLQVIFFLKTFCKKYSSFANRIPLRRPFCNIDISSREKPFRDKLVLQKKPLQRKLAEHMFAESSTFYFSDIATPSSLPLNCGRVVCESLVVVTVTCSLTGI